MKLSIIITAYQSHNFIEECLDSIESQTYFINNDNYEILLGIDNCIKVLYKIQDIKNKYRNLNIFYMTSNKGTYITSNTLIKESSGSFILRFDSDDYMKDDMIAKLYDNINQYDYLHFTGQNFKKFGQNVIMDNKIKSGDGIIAFNKNVLDKLGGYRDWVCGADSDFKKRLGLLYIGKRIEDVTYYRRLHSNQLTSLPETNKKSNKRIFAKEFINNNENYNELFVTPIINNYIKI